VTLKMTPGASTLRRAKVFQEVRRSIAQAHRPEFRVIEFSVLSSAPTNTATPPARVWTAGVSCPARTATSRRGPVGLRA
jgi:hypothetical protein